MNRDSPGGSEVKNLHASAGDVGLVPGSGRSPGEENGNPLQYCCLDNARARGAPRATVHGAEGTGCDSGTKQQQQMRSTSSDGQHTASFPPPLFVLRIKNHFPWHFIFIWVHLLFSPLQKGRPSSVGKHVKFILILHYLNSASMACCYMLDNRLSEEEAGICPVCQFLWCKCSHHGHFQNINRTSADSQDSWKFSNGLL